MFTKTYTVSQNPWIFKVCPCSSLAGGWAPYIHIILSYIVSITWYITQPLVSILLWWWACSSDTLVYPSIFTFPLFSLHHWSTTTHPCWHNCMHLHPHLLTHDTHLHFIRPASLIWWTDVLRFTCFISILSSPMCTLLWPDQSWILMLHSQALTIALLWMSLVPAFLFTICI